MGMTRSPPTRPVPGAPAFAYYDPFGDPIDLTTDLIGTTSSNGAVPNNTTTDSSTTGDATFGWEGSHSKLYQHTADIATIEMGDRQYVPILGRFLSVDPVRWWEQQRVQLPQRPHQRDGPLSGDALCWESGTCYQHTDSCISASWNNFCGHPVRDTYELSIRDVERLRKWDRYHLSTSRGSIYRLTTHLRRLQRACQWEQRRGFSAAWGTDLGTALGNFRVTRVSKHSYSINDSYDFNANGTFHDFVLWAIVGQPFTFWGAHDYAVTGKGML